MVKWLKGKIDEKVRASPSLPRFRDRLSQGGERSLPQPLPRRGVG
jgi:hypothetical protein